MMETSYFDKYPRVSLLLWALLGLGAGFLNGLLGAAGGILLVTLLSRMPPFPVRKHGASLPPPEGRAVFVMGLWVMIPATLVSATLYFARGMGGAPSLAVAIALPAAAGGLIGALLLGKIPRQALKKIFALLVLFAGLRMVLS
ncbi:MAG: TSUP family transporter [Clostridia bacterium]|nr:TSUP family transporter [Clostridia bacterium]